MKPFDLAPNEWWKAPTWLGSQIADVYDILPSGNGTQASIIDAWSGACFDSRRGDIIICNGGHTDYAGNEGYAFSVNPYSRFFLKWRLKWKLSVRTDGANVEAYTGDNSPSAAHTYCGLVYCPTQDLILRMPGVFTWGTTGGFTAQTWVLKAQVESPDKGVGQYWRKMTDSPGSVSSGNPLAAWDPVSGAVWIYRTSGSATTGMTHYNPATNTWTIDTTFDSGLLNEGNMSVALQPGKYWAACGGGVGNLMIMDIGALTWAGSGGAGFGATGATNIEGVSAPGFLYDGANFVGWGGLATGGTDTRDLYYLDVPSKVWTLVAGSGEIPTAPNANGTFGKFVYLGWGLAALFNSTTQDVYFVRTRTADQNEDTSPYYLPFLRGNTSRYFNPFNRGRVPGDPML